jgi:hypothetical protein
MADVTKQARRRGKSATDQADDARAEAEDETRDIAGSAGEGDGDSGDSKSGGSRTITS